MSTNEQLAKEYTIKILQAHNNKAQIDLVVRDVTNLVYTSTKARISTYDQNEILLLILKLIIDDTLTMKSADNANYLDLIAYISQQFGST